MKDKYPSLMRWTKKDRELLERTVNSFNRKVSQLAKMGYENLPSKESYEELRGIGERQKDEVFKGILSRREFNLKIESLKRFNESTAKTVTLDGGAKVTEWEKGEIGRLKRRATMNLEREIKDAYNNGADEDFIKARMYTLENLDNVYNLKGSDLKRKLEVLENNARGDRELRRAYIWRENYLDAVESLDGYENSDLLLEKLKSIKNPLEFYDYVNQSEMLSDLFLYYKESADTQTFGGFDNNQEAFNRGLIDLGIDINM